MKSIRGSRIRIPALIPALAALTALAALAVLTVLAGPAALAGPGVAAASDRGIGSWTGGGPKAKSIYAITVDPADPRVIYAGALGSGVFKTVDGGATWDPSTTGLTNTYVRAVAIDPRDRSIVFAGTNDGLFKSTDAGITWALSLSTPHSIRAIAFDASNPGLMYCGSLGAGVFRSTNLGTSWSSANSGLTDLNVRTIASHPVMSYVALAGSGTNGGINMTQNSGYSWTLTGSLDGRGAVYDVEYDPMNISRVYAGMFERGVARSDDGGVTWYRINSGLTTLRTRSLAVADTLRYVGTDSGGVFFSTLHTNWSARNGGLPNLLIRAVDTVQGSASTVLAGTDGAGLFKSADAGVSWTPINTYLTDVTGRSLLVRDDPGRTLVCGTGFGDGIWRSGDDGATWTPAAALGTRNSVLDLAEDPAAATLYAAIYASGVYRSTDGGGTWAPCDTTSLGNRFVRCLSVNPADGRDILVGTGNGIYRTTDGGLTWGALGNGIPFSTSIRSIARDHYYAGTLFAGSDSSGLYRTTDGGTSWIPSNNGLTESDVRCLAANPHWGSVLLGNDAGVFRSTDRGATWRQAGRGLPSGSVRDLVFDPSADYRVFAAVWEGGVYRSEDDGATFTPMNESLPDLKVYSLALNPERNVLYAGTRLRGVFAYTFRVADVPGPGDPGRTALRLQGRPSVLARSTEIRFVLPAAAEVELTLFDARGAVARTLARGILGAGAHAVPWDGTDGGGRRLPSGTYWARLRAGSSTGVTRLTLLR